MSTSTPTPASPRRKSVLFCPDCSHESAVDGDWVHRRVRNGLAYRCPVCSRTITVRPVRTADPVRYWTTVPAELARTWARYCRRVATATRPSLPRHSR